MPSHFDTANGSRPNTAVVAWLSLVEEEGGSGFRAALFHTTDGGEPVGFCFTRTFPRRTSEQGDDAGASATAHVLEQLLQAASPPSLILGLQRRIAQRRPRRQCRFTNPPLPTRGRRFRARRQPTGWRPLAEPASTGRLRRPAASR